MPITKVALKQTPLLTMSNDPVNRIAVRRLSLERGGFKGTIGKKRISIKLPSVAEAKLLIEDLKRHGVANMAFKSIPKGDFYTYFSKVNA